MKILAVNINGDITYCSASLEMRGMGRCNHIEHQNENETTQEFIQRIEDLRTKVQNSNDSNDKSFIPYDGAEIETLPYRMTDEEKEDLIKIENRMQLDQNIEGGYIELNEPLWNDMDKNYFSSLSCMHKNRIEEVLHGQSYVVMESDESMGSSKKFPVGKIIPQEVAEKIYKNALGNDGDDAEESKKISQNDVEDYFQQTLGITLGTGVRDMNAFAEDVYKFEPTRDIYILPYYMRIGAGEDISSDITIGYKYLLRAHKNPDNQQLAYEALLNNSSISKDSARYTKGYRNKSLADEFVGKGGVFRSQLSGSSIPYSARAVVTPEIMPYGELKIPASMAIDIFKPTLLEQFAYEGKSVEDIDVYFTQFRKPQVDIPIELKNDLEKRIANKRVIMNRQPSLHQSSLQSFKPKISSDATVKVHPLYCKAYGMDFDGDTGTIYGINQESIIPTMDKSIGAHNDINTHLPRSIESSVIMPDKDALWGLLNILSKRNA